MRVVHPFAEDSVLNFSDQFVFLDIVSDGVGGHVKQEEILLLCGQDSLLHQVLGEALADVLELVAQLQWVPSLSR